MKLKAKLKNTGEIINISEFCQITLTSCDSWGNPIQVDFNNIDAIYDEERVIYDNNIPKKDNIDWEQRRYEIAKEMLHAIYIDDGNAEREDDSGLPFEFKTLGNSAKEAVRFADALIEELKKNNNEKV